MLSQIEIKDKLGLTILVEQDARKALEIGNKSLLLVSGRSAYEGDAQALLSHPELGRLYLGIGVERKPEPKEPQPSGTDHTSN